MATLTVQVPEAVASALTALEGAAIDEYTIGTIVRDVLNQIQDEVHRLADDAPLPTAAEIRALADRLVGCAVALEAVNR